MIEKSFRRKNGFRITRAHPKKDVHPLIVDFQNDMKSETIAQTQECGLFRTPNQPETTAAIFTKGIVYAGRENLDTTCRNILVVRSKKTGEVRLIEVGKAALKAVITDQTEIASSEFEKGKLGEKFGSKRQKRNAEQNKKMKIDVDTVKEQLENTASLMEIDSLDVSNQMINVQSPMHKYTPPMDRDATNPDSVYKLTEILTPEQLDSLKSNATILLENDSYEIEISEYITDIIGKLRESQKPSKLEDCCALLYADCILRYLVEHYKKVCSLSYAVCSYSDLINSAVFNDFSIPSDKGRTRPQSLKDKGICYVIVLLLITGNCLIADAEKLRKALNISMIKLTQMVKVVGARLVTGSGPVQIVLKLPLVSGPTIKIKREKK